MMIYLNSYINGAEESKILKHLGLKESLEMNGHAIYFKDPGSVEVNSTYVRLFIDLDFDKTSVYKMVCMSITGRKYDSIKKLVVTEIRDMKLKSVL